MKPGALRGHPGGCAGPSLAGAHTWHPKHLFSGVSFKPPYHLPFFFPMPDQPPSFPPQRTPSLLIDVEGNRVHFPHLPLSDATSEGRAPWPPDLWEAEMLGATLKLGWRRLEAHPCHHFTLSCGHSLENAHLTGFNAEARYKKQSNRRQRAYEWPASVWFSEGSLYCHGIWVWALLH